MKLKLLLASALALCLSLHAQLIKNPSFETPVIVAFSGILPNPTNASWTFTGQAGEADDTSAYVSPSFGMLPDGYQVGYVGTNGVISQSFTNTTAGGYELRFYMSQNTFNNPFYTSQNLKASIDTNMSMTVTTPQDSAFYYFTTNVYLAAGKYTLSFASQTPASSMSLIDLVSLTPVPTLSLKLTNTTATVTLSGGITNRTYVLARRLTVNGTNTVLTDMTFNSSVTLTNQPLPNAFYLLSGAHD